MTDLSPFYRGDTQTYRLRFRNAARCGLPLNLRCAYDPTLTSLYPATGGSGTNGAILAGDTWEVSTTGTINSHGVTAYSTIQALVNSPGQLDANWAFLTNVDITGWTIWMTLKSSTDLPDTDAVAQVQMTAQAGADSTNGLAYLMLTEDHTSDLTAPATYFYDFQRVIPSTPPYVRTIVAGKVKVLADVTRNVG